MTAPAKAGLSFASAPDVLRVTEAAGLARVGAPAIYAACKSGALWSVTIGHSIRIPRRALMNWLGLDESVPAENEPAPTLRPVEAGKEDSRGTGRRTQA